MSLGGFAEAVPTDRLFFAIYPDDAAGKAIARLAGDIGEQYRLRGKPLPTERLHITLHHLGDYAGLPAKLVEDAQCAAGRVIAAPFAVAFDRVASFAKRADTKPCVLLGTQEDTPLQQLRKQLGLCLIQAGLGKQVTRDFTPHVTLRYERVLLPEETVAPIAWTVREFVLVHSLLGQTKHVILQRWPLQG
jgi:2'-5' RNA ligase